MSPEQLRKHMLGTYSSLRWGLVVVAALLPPVLYVAGKALAGVCLQNSMSAYYWATTTGYAMRDWFVGSLWAVGGMLIVYQGYTKAENWLLNLAGALAVGVAQFPMRWLSSSQRACDGTYGPASADKSMFSLHGFFAVSFFLCIAAVCFFCADATLTLIKDEKRARRLRMRYRLIAGVMAGSIIAAYLVNVLANDQRAAFWVEFAGIYSFVWYWTEKSFELRRTEAELDGTAGNLAVESGQVRQVRAAATGRS